MKIVKTLFQSYALIMLAASFLLLSCSAQSKKSSSSDPELVFQSGFEGNIQVVSIPGTNDYGALQEKIIGKDNQLRVKSDFDKDWTSVLKNGTMQVQYTGGDSTKRFAKVVNDPTKAGNKVLHYWLNDGWSADLNLFKARIQTNLYGIKPGYKELYQSVRVYLTEDFNALKNYPRRIGWLTISEFWNNITWSNANNAFRVTLGIGKPQAEAGDLHFLLDGQDFERVDGKEKYTTIWHEMNKNLKVPIGKWFTMDYYFKEGNKETGRFYMTITPEGEAKQVVFDVTAFTHNTHDLNPDGLTDYNPMKLYTSKDLVNYVGSQGKTLQIYWDDFKLWKNKRP